MFLLTALIIHIIGANVTASNPDSTINQNLITGQEFSLDSVEIDTLKVNKWKKRLLDELIGKPSNDTIVVADEDSTKQNDLLQYQDRIIRNIEFRQLEIFGPSLSDTAALPKNWVERLGNGLHVHTQEFALRNRLLINKGDKVDAYLLAENERLIREMHYIDDAKVFINEAPGDSVDLIFITKDVFPIGASLELLDVLYGKASFLNQNLMGLGHEFYYHLRWNNDTVPLYGHRFRYYVPNIGNSFFSAEASYENSWFHESIGIKVDRNFFASNTKYAGGTAFDKIRSVRNVEFPDTTHIGLEVDYNYYNLWLGRSFSLPFLSTMKRKTNLVVTSRIMRFEFYKRPQVRADFLYNFHERILYLVSAGVANQGYQKDRLIYGFGRTEDIPFGLAFSITAGAEDNEFYNRAYIGLEANWASRITPWGRFSEKATFGTFLNTGAEQGLLDIQLNHFTPLLNKTNRFKYRVFSNLHYKAGYHRFEDEFMAFSKTDGIRGLQSINLRGNQRLNLNLEAVCYSPHVILGFRFVYFAFLDLGIISHDYSRLFSNQLYSGFGAGVRVRNENLIINTIQFRLAYYPVVPANALTEHVLLNTRSDRKFENFLIQQPEVVQYQTR